MSSHLRPRDGNQQPTTVVELFFDLVYVFAVTQLSHLLIGNLGWSGLAQTGFLLLVIWWAWIYTTWMVNWFDPGSTRVSIVLMLVMLASLLMAAAVPNAFGRDAKLFVAAYVTLQVGRNLAGMLLLEPRHPLRAVFERILVWSVASGVFWVAGAFLSGQTRLWLWLPALAIELAGPLAGYATPGRGTSQTDDYTIDGGHFAERCQAFVIIALGESIVVTGATAAGAGLSAVIVVSLAAAFLVTASLWWLYFAEVAEHSRRRIAESDDPGRLARDAYTYLHLPIVAGVIVSAVGDELLLAHPGHSFTAVGATMALGGPILFLAGETFFRLRMIGSANLKRLTAIAALAALGLLTTTVSALALTALAALVLLLLGVWEYSLPPLATGPDPVPSHPRPRV